MFELPLHPTLVHLPLALVVLLPLVAAFALIAGYRSGNAKSPWAMVVLLHVLLAASAVFAAKAGERDEEKVEAVLASEEPLETHEEAGELFLRASLALLLLAALGLAPGRLGMTSRALASVAFLGLLVLGIRAGHSGGLLVYRHGAGAAFSSEAAANSVPTH